MPLLPAGVFRASGEIKNKGVDGAIAGTTKDFSSDEARDSSTTKWYLDPKVVYTSTEIRHFDPQILDMGIMITILDTVSYEDFWPS